MLPGDENLILGAMKLLDQLHRFCSKSMMGPCPLLGCARKFDNYPCAKLLLEYS